MKLGFLRSVQVGTVNLECCSVLLLVQGKPKEKEGPSRFFLRHRSHLGYVYPFTLGERETVGEVRYSHLRKVIRDTGGAVPLFGLNRTSKGPTKLFGPLQ